MYLDKIAYQVSIVVVFNCVIIAWSFLHNDQENIPTFWFLLDLVTNYQISIKFFKT